MNEFLDLIFKFNVLFVIWSILLLWTSIKTIYSFSIIEVHDKYREKLITLNTLFEQMSFITNMLCMELQPEFRKMYEIQSSDIYNRPISIKEFTEYFNALEFNYDIITQCLHETLKLENHVKSINVFRTLIAVIASYTSIKMLFIHDINYLIITFGLLCVYHILHPKKLFFSRIDFMGTMVDDILSYYNEFLKWVTNGWSIVIFIIVILSILFNNLTILCNATYTMLFVISVMEIFRILVCEYEYVLAFLLQDKCHIYKTYDEMSKTYEFKKHKAFVKRTLEKQKTVDLQKSISELKMISKGSVSRELLHDIYLKINSDLYYTTIKLLFRSREYKQWLFTHDHDYLRDLILLTRLVDEIIIKAKEGN